MPQFFMVRLGADSEADIKRIDDWQPNDPLPLNISVKCKQVPRELAPNDFTFVWLGTNNNKGQATPWKQGLRGFGTVVSVTGGAKYKDEKTINISVGIILRCSAGKLDFVDATAARYRALSEMPVIGVNNYSSQVVQKIAASEPRQNVGALLVALETISPGFAEATAKMFPDFSPPLGDTPPALEAVPDEAQTVLKTKIISPVPSANSMGNWDVSVGNIKTDCRIIGAGEAITRALAALRSGMHVVFTGPPGTGKTSLAEHICKSAGFAAWTVPATDQWTTFETIGGYFPSPGDNEKEASVDSERLDFLSGAVVDAIENQKCLIIDEINRADIDKAFGELFTLLTGKSVTLPYRRRSEQGFRRVRLLTGNDQAEEGIDAIPVPAWWRLIGTMNDADKASLKRLSLAFVRRFAFVPLGMPSKSDYETILSEEIARASPDSRVKLTAILNHLTHLFCDPDMGFNKIGMPLGPAIPITMLQHAVVEWRLDPARAPEEVMRSVLELYVAPQFQGRADKHELCIEQLAYVLDANGLLEYKKVLAVWTGYDE